VEGDWKLNEAMVGGKASLSRLAMAASLLFPHYAKMREAARISTYKAMLLEQAGHPDQGLAIRNALMHVGSLMRVQSHTIIGSLVGIAITGEAMKRPGGAPYLKGGNNQDSRQIEQARLDQYCAYLTRIDHGDQVAWVRGEHDAGVRARSFLRFVANDQFLMAPVRAGLWWGVDFLSLACECWLLVLGLVAFLLGRIGPIQADQPLPPPVRWGVACASGVLGVTAVYIVCNLLVGWAPAVFPWLVLVLSVLVYAALVVRGFQISRRHGIAVALLIPAACLLAVGIMQADPPSSIYFLSILCAAVPVLIVWLLLPQRLGKVGARPDEKPRPRPPSWQDIRTGLMTFGPVMLSFALLAGLAALQMRPLAEEFSVISALSGLTNIAMVGATHRMIVAAVVLLVLITLPGLIGTYFALSRRAPLAAMLVCAYRIGAVPAACIVLIGYGALVLVTLRAEGDANYVLEQTVAHEGAYYAQQAGEPWPGPVSAPDPAITRH